MFKAPDHEVIQSSGGFQAPAHEVIPDGEPWSNVPRNAWNEAKDIAVNVPLGMANLLTRIPPFNTGRVLLGENPYSQESLKSTSKLIGSGLVESAKQMGQSFAHPIESFKKRPISTALDLSLLGEGAAEGVNLARRSAGSIIERGAPSVAKATAGIPEKAMSMASENPQILEKAPVPEEMLSKTVGDPMIQAMKATKARVSGIFGKAYEKYTGLKNPVQRFIDDELPPSRSFEEIRDDYKRVLSGDIYKEADGSKLLRRDLTNKEQLAKLSELKREIQSEARFNRAPITNAPIDTVKDAALKKMSSDVDEARTALPNGKKLAAVDQAWKNIHDIYDTIQKDLSDPGKAKDTMMRLLKQDHTWLTSGRMSGKVNAIRKAELISGQNILTPALEELTRQVFKDWGGKGFVSQVLKGSSTVLGGYGLTNPAALPVAAAGLASSSPRVIRGAIRVGSKANRLLSSGLGKALPITRPAGLSAILLAASRKKK